MGFETTVLLLTWVAIALLAFVVSGLVRRVHHLGTGVRTAELGPAPGSAAPQFGRLTAGLSPGPSPGPSPGRADRTLLLFLDADCGVCPQVLAELRDVLDGSGRTLPVAALFADRALEGGHEGIEVFAGEAGLFEEYRIPAVPFAVLADGSGRVRTARPVGSPGALRDLLETVLETLPETAVGRQHAPVDGGTP
ncbi:hypothetical protein SAMN04489712_11383 [Thermomonospora echinospora]|uniref:Thioredoxin domain-containing protein n=1 Tax=Thermomonospora echinospora TaxID=1992 RepID=A0A1H6D5B7_9ACTN|nr:hypothetical protein [Thermomonospora echinospora]SEG80451.1 hypothetical protein SAMN04489712_11383 [Thermomonospora echinospora]